MTSEKERIGVALSLAAGMLDLDADQMDDERAANNCRGAARIIRENYDLLIAGPALRERVAELEGAQMGYPITTFEEVWQRERESGRRPTVVVLCGSTRFKQEFIEANFRETMAGKIVLSVGWFSHADAAIYPPTPEEKVALDALHFRKVEMADEVLVINPSGYIGQSTANEIRYAESLSRPIRYLVPPADGLP